MSFEFIEWWIIFASSFGILLIAYYLFDSPISPIWKEGPAKDANDPRSSFLRYFLYSFFAISASVILWALVHGKVPPDNQYAFSDFLGFMLLEGLVITILQIFAPIENPKDPQYRARSRFVNIGLILAYATVSVPFLK
jgi:p-aminobenzoyl-glutamate transporter AbgT